MLHSSRSVLSRVLAVVAVLLVCKVTLSVILEYRHYFPPNFHSEFLRGREAYFFGAYGWAFYTHLVAGPASLVLGTVLISDRFRTRAANWHRRLGRVQGVCVLLFLAPSGLVMAPYAATGAVAAVGLGSLATATAACVLLGWKAAAQRRFLDHRRWMWRMYMLLLSAVVIRIIGGLATVAGFDAVWLYPLSCWASWLVPLMVYACVQLLQPAVQRVPAPL